MRLRKTGWKRIVSVITALIVTAAPVFSSFGTKAEDTGEKNTMTDAQYAEFGLVNNSPAEFTSDGHPMEGYEPKVISELYLSQMGRYDNWKGGFDVLDNTDEVSKEAFNVDTMAKNATVGTGVSYSANKAQAEVQTHNACAMDYDGDGVDEILDTTLYVDKISFDKDPKKRSCMDVKVYDCVDGKWTEKGSKKYELADGKSDNSCFVDRIEADASKGLAAITAWDYDGDGKDEGAVYVPSQIGDNPYISIVKAENGNINEVHRIYLKELNGTKNTFDFHYKNWQVPIVSLTTTKISGSEDLVINAGHPLKSNDGYGDKGQCSAIGIFHYNNGSFEKPYLDSEMTYGNVRMRMCQAVDADLNGNGVEELVIGGYKNGGWNSNSDVGWLASDKNLIQLLCWDAKNGKYKRVWDTPKEVEARGGLKTDLEMTEPAALTAAALTANSSIDYVFLEGNVFKYNGAAQEGADERALYQSGSFEKKHSMELGGSHSAFISTAYGAMFSTGGGLSEQIVVLSGDHQQANNDNIYYDIVWIWEENGTVTSAVTNNDYIHCKNEDDNGTFVAMCPLDADEDKVVLEYRGKNYGWSDPVLYSVLQSPPYWSELTYNSESFGAGKVSYEVTYGSVNAVDGDWGIGVGTYMEVSAVGGVGGGGTDVMFGGGMELGFMAKYAGSYGTSHGKTDSYKISIPPGEDQAVILAVPMVSHHYSMWVPEYTVTDEDIKNYKEMYKDNENVPEEYTVFAIDKDTGKLLNDKGTVYKAGDTVPGHWEDYNVSSTFTPSFSHISLEKYNELAERYKNRGLNKVEDSLLTGKTIGDPSTYPSEKEKLYDPAQVGSLFISKNTATVTPGEGEHELSYEVEDEEELSNGFSLSFDGSVFAKAISRVSFIASSEGEFVAGIKGELEGGASWITTNSKGNGYSASVVDLGKDASEDYGFSTQLAVFEAKNLPKGDGDSQGASVVGYLVTGIDEATAPPKLPVDLRVYGTTKTAAALKWEEAAGQRAADSYEVFIKDNLGETRSLGKTTDTYMTAGNLSPATEYQFAVKSYKGLQSSCMSRWVTAVTKGGGEPVFTRHPENVIVSLSSGDVSETSVTLTAKAEPGEPDAEALEYEWQKYEHADLTMDGTWVTAADGTVSVSELGESVYELPEINGTEGYPAYYRVIATQKKGGGVKSAVSKTATVFINESGDPSVSYQELNMDLCMESADIVLSEEESGLYYMIRGNADADFKVALAPAAEGGTIPSGGEVQLMYYNGNQMQLFKDGRGTIDGNELSIHLSGGIGMGSYEVVAVYPGNTGTAGESILYPAAVSNPVYINVLDSYHMEYHLNGGSSPAPNQEAAVYGGGQEMIGVDLISPLKEGYSFAGWYSDEGLTQPFEQQVADSGRRYVYIDPMPYESSHIIDLYAKWEPVEYTIAYELNGGENSPLNPGSYTIESYGITFADAVRSGYNFGGWYTDPELTGQITSISQGTTGDMVLYAKWEEIPSLPQDEDGAYKITCYEDLVWAAQMIRDYPEIYAGASYVQMNNINCNEQEWELPIGTQEHPFEGTYQGNDYYVLGLKQGSGSLGGLFGVIGAGGAVRNLSVVDFDYKEWTDIAGGVAAINYGLIDGCGSGANIHSAATIFRDGKPVPISTLNSEIKGTFYAGGIAGQNEGVIKNSHSNAQVTGQTAGGIAGVNSGSILNIYNTGNVSAMASAGGIAGANTGAGSIRYGYNSTSASVSGGGTLGGIAGTSENSSIQDMWYLSEMSGACGNMEDSAFASAGPKTEEEMRNPDFKDLLNGAVQGEKDALGLRDWDINSGKNGGLPTLEYQVIEQQTLSASKFGIHITVTGQIHPGTKLSFIKLDKEHEDYQAMKDAVNNKKLTEGWQLALLNEDGTYATWNGSLTVNIKADNPGALEGLRILHKNPEGAYSEQAIENQAEGLTIQTDSLNNLGIMKEEEKENPENPKNPEETDNTAKKPGENAAAAGNGRNQAAGTGDEASLRVMLVLLLLSGGTAVLVSGIRKRRIRQR